MKNISKTKILLCSLLLCIGINIKAQSKSMLAWQGLLDKPELAKFFSGIFDNLGIEVIETNEKFTVHHLGDHFKLSEGIDEKSVDFVVSLNKENIENMARHGADASINADEAWRIVAVLFTPFTEASFEHPVLQKPLSQKLSGIENHLHIILLNNQNETVNDHTVVYVNKQWLVAEGTLGTPQRVYTLTPEEALNYQRHLFKGMKANTAKEWKVFKKWYVKWREGVSMEIK